MNRNGFDRAIEGMVVDASNKPVTGALVQCFYFHDTQSKEGNSAWTNNGHFTIKGLQPAVYTIRVRMKGYGSKQVDQIDLMKKPTYRFQDPIVLQKSKGIEIVVTTPEGEQIQGAKMILKVRAQRGSSFYWTDILEEFTDAQGKVIFKDISDGGYFITVSKEGYTKQNEQMTIRNGKIANRWPGLVVLRRLRK